MVSTEAFRTPEHMFALFEACVPETKNVYPRMNAEGKWLTANGLVSEIQDELLHKIVRTPTFKKWFGDWERYPDEASIAVYETTGEPRVVFHGTNKNIPIAEGLDTNKGKRPEVMFTSSKADALGEGGASARRSDTEGVQVVFPCFINIRPLKEIGARGDWRISTFTANGSKVKHYVVQHNNDIMHIPFSI